MVKARILYNLFGIETKVLNFNEFEEYIYLKEKDDLSFDFFAKSLGEVFENGTLEDDFEIEDQNKRVLVYKLDKALFNFFNRLNLVITNKDTPMYIFYNEIKNYSRFTSFTEFKKITDKIVTVLGTDSNNKSEFTEEDRKLIIEYSWQGRVWHFQNESFYIEVEQNEKKLCFYFLPSFKI